MIGTKQGHEMKECTKLKCASQYTGTPLVYIQIHRVHTDAHPDTQVHTDAHPDTQVHTDAHPDTQVHRCTSRQQVQDWCTSRYTGCIWLAKVLTTDASV